MRQHSGIWEDYFYFAKELVRLNGIMKSPIENHSSESIVRGMTIRAFRVEDQLLKKNIDIIDKNSSPFFYSFGAIEWLVQHLEVLNATLLSSSDIVMVLLSLGSLNLGMNNEIKCQLLVIYAIFECFYV